MKRTSKSQTLAALMAGAVSLWSVAAQAETTTSSTTPSGSSTTTPGTTSSSTVTAASLANQDAILKQDGTVYFLKQGKPQKVDKEMRLAEGVTIESDGDVTLRDGAKVTLKDGQLITLDGRIMTAPAGILEGTSTSTDTTSGSR